MTGYVRIGAAGSLPDGGVQTARVGRYEVAVFHVGAGYYALENACPHQGGPIADGWVEELTVTCPWHAWCFDLRTGKLTLGDFATIPRFDVREDAAGLWISEEPISQ